MLIVTPLWDSEIVLCFVVRYFVPILVLPSSRCNGDERAGCFALFVLLVSCDWCVALYDTTNCLQFVILVFPDHTHLLFLIIERNKIENRDSE